MPGNQHWFDGCATAKLMLLVMSLLHCSPLGWLAAVIETIMDCIVITVHYTIC